MNIYKIVIYLDILASQLTVTSRCSLKMYSWHSAAAAPPSTGHTAQTCSFRWVLNIYCAGFRGIHLLLVVVQTFALMNFIVYCTLYRGWAGQ